MRERRRATRRGQSNRLLLLAVMLVAMVATSSHADDTDGASAPPSAQRSEAPAVNAPAPAPPATARPESAPPTVPAPTVPVTMAEAAPVRLQIPSIGVDSELMGLGLQPDGTLEVPPGGFPAGWYTGAPTPGELGPAIIAGHVDWGGQPGVFFDLREVSPGDEIEIDRRDGTTARFRVTKVDQFDKGAFPTQAVYGDLGHAGLRLITCGGGFDREMRSYEDNLVVFAELVEGDTARPVP